MQKPYISVDEIQKNMGIKQVTAYKLVQKLNKQLKEEGCITVAGKCPRKFFEDKTMYDTSSEYWESET